MLDDEVEDTPDTAAVAPATFNAAFEKMKMRKASVLGVSDFVTQNFVQFKMANEQKNFNLVHCWTALNDCPKWHDLYASYDANAPSESKAINVDGVVPSAPMKRPKGGGEDEL
jgi:hypothetical protein